MSARYGLRPRHADIYLPFIVYADSDFRQMNALVLLERLIISGLYTFTLSSRIAADRLPFPRHRIACYLTIREVQF